MFTTYGKSSVLKREIKLKHDLPHKSLLSTHDDVSQQKYVSVSTSLLHLIENGQNFLATHM